MPLRFHIFPRLRPHLPLLCALAITAFYAALLLPLVLHHAVWRDEAQAWLLARDSTSLSDLFHNMRYEGHPPLWHVLLFFISRFTSNVMAMQLLNALISVASVFLLARYAPFNLLEKFLFTGGYYILFEYGVLARNYQIATVLLFAFCALWSRRRTLLMPQFLVLALLCFANIYAFIIAVPLALMLVIDALLSPTQRQAVLSHPFRFAGALALLGICAAVSIRQTNPPADSGYAVGWTLQLPEKNVVRSDVQAVANNAVLSAQLDEALQVAWDAYVPLTLAQDHFWCTNPQKLRALVADYIGALRARGMPLPARDSDVQVSGNWCITLLAVVALGLACRTRALLLFLVGAAGIIAFSYIKFQGFPRHHGHLFLLTIACFWIALVPRPRPFSTRQQILSLVPSLMILGFLLWGFPSAFSVLLPFDFASLARYQPDFLSLVDPWLPLAALVPLILIARARLQHRRGMHTIANEERVSDSPPGTFRTVTLLLLDALTFLFLRLVPHIVLLALLLVQVYAANQVLPTVRRIPFSASQNAAAYLATQLKPNEVIVTDADSIAAALAAYLPAQRFYFTRGNRFGTYNIWDSATSTTRVFPAARTLANSSRASVMVMTTGERPGTNDIPLLKSFSGGIQGDEQFYFFRVLPRR